MKKFVSLAFKALPIVVMAAFIASCFTQYISPAKSKLMSFFALGFIPLAVATLLLAVAWFFVNKKVAALLFIALLPGYKNFSTSLAFNLPKKYQLSKNPAALRVISWNIRSFDNNARYAEEFSVRRKMINFLKQQNADVLLLQEFVEYDNAAIYSNIHTLSDSLGFKYYYTSNDITLNLSFGSVVFGCAIFSKFPLTDTFKILYENLAQPEYVIHGNILFHGKNVRVATTHLSSLFLFPVQRYPTDFPRKDSLFIRDAPVYTKLAFYDRLHARQAALVQKFIGSISQPVVFSADLNAVPTSYTYQTISQNLKDAFLQKGTGLGATYSSLSPTLRIDYIFTSKNIITRQYYSPRLSLSDHYPVVADLQIDQ